MYVHLFTHGGSTPSASYKTFFDSSIVLKNVLHYRTEEVLCKKRGRGTQKLSYIVQGSGTNRALERLVGE